MKNRSKNLSMTENTVTDSMIKSIQEVISSEISLNMFCRKLSDMAFLSYRNFTVKSFYRNEISRSDLINGVLISSIRVATLTRNINILKSTAKLHPLVAPHFLAQYYILSKLFKLDSLSSDILEFYRKFYQDYESKKIPSYLKNHNGAYFDFVNEVFGSGKKFTERTMDYSSQYHELRELLLIGSESDKTIFQAPPFNVFSFESLYLSENPHSLTVTDYLPSEILNFDFAIYESDYHEEILNLELYSFNNF